MDDNKHEKYNDRQLLYRIDERTTLLMKEFHSVKNTLEQKLLLQDALIEKKLAQSEDKYISREEFEPIKNIIYGLVSLILTSVFGSLLYLVLRNQE